MSDSIPVFTPPSYDVPTFTPPSGRHYHNSSSCYYHPGEPSVANCNRCGKHLCRDCYEAYGVSAGEYANQALCYDCTQQLVSENVAELSANIKVIKTQFIISLVGIVFGAIFGFSLGSENGFGTGLFSAILGAGIGGVFLTALKAFASLLWESIKSAFESENLIAAVIGFFFGFFIIAIKCVFIAIKNTIFYISYLKNTSGALESDQAALEQMRDYMEYTQVRNRNIGVDLDTLMSQGSELYNNSFAQMVRDRGEAEALESVSNAAATIASNGEIIRNFS